MIKKIAITAAGLVVILIIALMGFIATRPDNFMVQRSVTIKSPPAKIFDLIDDFHKWRSWSPYENLDPTMKRTYSGAPVGKGAVYAWDGTDAAGAGTMEITESTPPSKVAIKLDFSKPFEGHNFADFTLQPQGESTTVTWAMHGPSPVMMKVMGLFVNMDSMLGKDFEVGLNNLKTVTEKK
jgi:uncharacterized protein YndB with AHSA1/START domain